MGYAVRVPNGILTMSGLDRDKARKGQIYKCTYSTFKPRIGQNFHILRKSDIDELDFFSSYGDNFELIHEVKQNQQS